MFSLLLYHPVDVNVISLLLSAAYKLTSGPLHMWLGTCLPVKLKNSLTLNTVCLYNPVLPVGLYMYVCINEFKPLSEILLNQQSSFQKSQFSPFSFSMF